MDWISVKDRLPPQTGEEFVVANFNNQPSLKAVAWYHKVHKQFRYTGGRMFNIEHQTHWMSLPPEAE